MTERSLQVLQLVEWNDDNDDDNDDDEDGSVLGLRPKCGTVDMIAWWRAKDVVCSLITYRATVRTAEWGLLHHLLCSTRPFPSPRFALLYALLVPVSSEISCSQSLHSHILCFLCSALHCTATMGISDVCVVPYMVDITITITITVRVQNPQNLESRVHGPGSIIAIAVLHLCRSSNAL